MLNEQNVTHKGVAQDALDLLRAARKQYKDCDDEMKSKVTDYMTVPELDKLAQKKKKRPADAPDQQPPAKTATGPAKHGKSPAGAAPPTAAQQPSPASMADPQTAAKPTGPAGSSGASPLSAPPLPASSLPASAPVPADEGAAEVRLYMESVKLGQYADKLIKLGYDDINYLQDEVDLDTLKGHCVQIQMKEPHIGKLLHALKKFRPTAPASGPAPAAAAPSPLVAAGLAAAATLKPESESATPVNLAAAGTLFPHQPAVRPARMSSSIRPTPRLHLSRH